MAKITESVEKIIRINPDTKNGLLKLGISTIEDLLNHFPARYIDSKEFRSIASLKDKDEATIYGNVLKIETKKTFKGSIPASKALISDGTGKINVIWFNQPYIAKMYPKGTSVSLSGKITNQAGHLSMANPDINKEKAIPIDSHDSLFANEKEGRLTPVYGETKGVSSLWFKNTINRALKLLDDVEDFIPEEILKKYNLPKRKTAYVWIHSPYKKEDALVARKRFSFEEIFLIQLSRQKERAIVREKSSYEIEVGKEEIENFTKRFNFPLTKAQKKSIEDIICDLKKESPMSRLLEGDVGSGKTAVAATATFATVINRPKNNGEKQTFGNLQVAYMAPTEILATQHFESFVEYFKDLGVSIALITGSGCRKFPSKVASSKTNWTTISRNQLAKWISSGEIPIVIGTHTLIQKSLIFKHLALAIIDEQHRFGLKQRQKLAKKDSHFPHLLSMTATPIPRTLALTIYGDLDLSLLDEMPAGRKPVITKIVLPEQRDSIYEEIKEELKKRRQLYVICPRIEEPDPNISNSLQLKSVESEYKRLSKDIFKEFNVGRIHGKMSKDRKEKTMQEFSNKEIDILVATSVIEVGVNVPNATMIIIEGAERFGLAQLHQLRGRVARSKIQAYCYLFADTKTNKTEERLRLFTKAKNGFELAEYDLQTRGAGELTGKSQWGITDLGMEAIKNMKLVEIAREEAKKIISNNLEIKKFPLLREKINILESTHFE